VVARLAPNLELAHHVGMKASVISFVVGTLLAASGVLAEDATNRSFLIGTESFAQHDIVDARAQPGIDGVAFVLVTLEPAAGARFGAITKAHVGKALPIKLNGKMLMEPIVHEPVLGGTFQISGNFSLREAEALALQISGKPPLPDSLEE
jgi:preprotein translocase subunit SecD